MLVEFVGLHIKDIAVAAVVLSRSSRGIILVASDMIDQLLEV